MDEKTRETYELIRESAVSQFPLSSIKKLKDLQNKYPDDSRLQLECSVWIATIYEKNRQFSEALTIYEELIKDYKGLGLSFASVLLSTLALLTQEGRVEKAQQLFLDHISDEHIPFIPKLHMLKWYAENVNTTTAEGLQTVRSLLNVIADYLGVTLTEGSLKSQILNLNELHREANFNHMKYETSLKDRNKDDCISIMRQYIESCPMPLYRKIAEKSLATLLNKA